MLRLILARHGESELSAAGILNGDPAVPCALTPAGVEQARAFAARIAAEPVDLCVTSPFPRVVQTAELALAGRDVPRLVLPELGDPGYGNYEGGSLEAYRAWAAGHGPDVPAPGGGESRAQIAARYARALAAVLDRPEASILLVAHSLTVRYAADAGEGIAPRPRVALVPYAEPFRLDAEGYLEIPELPGLGLRLDRDKLAQYTPDPSVLF